MTHNAPGKYYRKGISMLELQRMFPDEETAPKVVRECYLDGR